MPLPPAPTKRAALLSADSMDAPARSPAKAAQRTSNTPRAQKTPVLDLFDNRLTNAGGDAQPAALISSDSRTTDLTYSTLQKSVDARMPATPQSKVIKKPKHTGPTKLIRVYRMLTPNFYKKGLNSRASL